jgi:hypothetical protein
MRLSLPGYWLAANRCVQREASPGQQEVGCRSDGGLLVAFGDDLERPADGPAQSLPTWIHPLGFPIAMVSAILIPAAFAYRGPVVLAIPAFFTGVIICQSRRFIRRR